ncbi:MAG TPA: helix-turn-helix domain-containing protein [Acidimicrobiales bacterium]|nr:helix-turn-helix domain-containing protein [Acidimicrobiales bacterium]
MTSPRRIGATDSKTREALLDAAERLLLDDGYAAVTSRRVAAAAGLKPQLVHYYFRTMDDLFVEVLRRNADASLAHAERVLAADGSLAALWSLNNDPRGARFLVEMAALANHRKDIRAEIARYAKRNRALQLKALKAALPEGTIPPMVALVLMTGLGQVMGIEQALGVTEGHAATRAFVADAIARLDAEP